MAVEPFIVVGMALLIIIILVINVYVMAYYTHPEDKNESYLAKALVIFGLQLSSMSVLMLPIDIANNMGNPYCDENAPSSNTYCGRINMYDMWESLFNMIGFTVVVLLPFAFFYYGLDEKDIDVDIDSDSPKKKKSRFACNCSLFGKALAYESVIIAAFLILILVLYYTVGTTSIPVAETSGNFNELPFLIYSTPPGKSPYSYIPQTLSADELTILSTYQSNKKSISYNLNFPIYLTGLFGWLGFWVFSFFAGAGLTVLPTELITAFIWRPQRLSHEEVSRRELELQDRTAELIEVSLLIKRERLAFRQTAPSYTDRNARLVADRVDLNRLTQMVFILERDYEEFQACKELRNDYKVLMPYFKVIMGSIFAFVSTLWVVHIMVYMLPSPPPPSLFLNTYFLWFNTWFPIFGYVSYSVFSLYLLFCTIKGCFKLGLSLFFFKIYPVKVSGTFMDAFLFNLMLILFCTVPLIQFSTMAFAAYAVDSDVFLIFGVQIFYLQGYTVFYENKVFTYMLLLTAFIMAAYSIRKPRDTAFSTEDFKTALHRRGGSSGGGVDDLEGGPYEKGDIMDAFGRGDDSSKKKKKKKKGLAEEEEDDEEEEDSRNRKGKKKDPKKEKQREKERKERREAARKAKEDATSKGKDKGKEKEKEKEKEGKDKDKKGSKGKDRASDIDTDRESNAGRSKDRNKDKERERGRSKERDNDKGDRGRSKSRDRDKSVGRDKEDKGGKDSKDGKGKDKDKGRDSKGRDASASRERDGKKKNKKDRDRDQFSSI